MGTSVFISYAVDDPDWSASSVRQLAGDLESLGATVELDLFFTERRQRPGKPSTSEWREWMARALETADHIVCLCSPRYRLAAERNLADRSGFGVAYESQKLMARLYRDKGRNQGRILTLRADGASATETIPDDLQDDCPEYQWPRERQGVVEHACRRRLERDVTSYPVGQPNDAAAPTYPADSLSPGARRTADVLVAAMPFFEALMARRRQNPPAPPWANADASPDVFVVGADAAELREARQLMWDVRHVLKHVVSLPRDEATTDAAIAVYLLCASRWMKERPPVVAGRAVRVPKAMDSLNVLAVLSAAMFGGNVMFHRGAAQPVAQHVYDVRVAVGESRSINLLRAIHSALHRDRMAAVEEARLDGDDDATVRHLLAEIQTRVDEACRVDDSAFTLLIEDPATYEDAPWRDRLDVVPFCIQSDLAHDLYCVDPEHLASEILAFWPLVQSQAVSKSTPPPPTTEAPMTAPPSIQISATNVTMTTGPHSPATSHVTQVQGTKLDELLPALQALMLEIDKLSPPRLRESLGTHAKDIATVIESKPADTKSRFTKALDSIKLVANAVEGTETLMTKAAHLAALAAPILAGLS